MENSLSLPLGKLKKYGKVFYFTTLSNISAEMPGLHLPKPFEESPRGLLIKGSGIRVPAGAPIEKSTLVVLFSIGVPVWRESCSRIVRTGFATLQPPSLWEACQRLQNSRRSKKSTTRVLFLFCPPSVARIPFRRAKGIRNIAERLAVLDLVSGAKFPQEQKKHPVGCFFYITSVRDLIYWYPFLSRYFASSSSIKVMSFAE